MKQIALSALCLSCVYGATAQSTSVLDTTKVIALQEVSVLGTKATKKTPMSYSNLTKETIKKSNLGQDLPFLLQMQPSVLATSDAGTGMGYTALRVRGVDATGINITTNGVPINDSESQAVFWVNMPDFASSVQELQIQRGVGTSANGAAAFGASINMRTDNLSLKPYAEVGVSGGSFSTFRRNVRVGTGRLGGHWAVDARLSKITSNGYVDRATVDLGSYFVQTGYFGERTALRFVTFGGVEKTGIAWNGISKEQEEKFGRTYNPAGHVNPKAPANQAYYYPNTDNYNQKHYQLILTHRPSESLSLNLTGHYTEGFGYTDEYRTGRKLVEYGLNKFKDANGKTVSKTSLIRRKYLDNDFYGIITSANWKQGAWDVNVGLSGNYYYGDHYGERRWVENYPEPVYPESRYYQDTGRKGQAAAYIKANYQITQALSAYADLQYRFINYRIEGTYDGYDSKRKKMQDINLNKTFNFVNPKAGLYYQIAPEHHAYASVAVAHREPNRKGYTEVSPEDYPRHERMIDYELGYGYTGDSFKLSANLYYMDYKDQLVANGKLSDVGGVLQENVDKSYRMGLEVMSALKLTSWLRWDASLALSQSKIKDYSYHFSTYDKDWEWSGLKEVKYKDTDIAYSPSVIMTNALSVVHSGLDASLISQFVSKQYLDNTADAARSLPAYHTLGLRLGYDLPLSLAKRWNVSLQVNNLLNTLYSSNGYIYDTGIQADGTTYSDVRYFPQAGINFLLGTTITF